MRRLKWIQRVIIDAIGVVLLLGILWSILIFVASFLVEGLEP